MTALYTAEATAWGGREGRVASSDGRVDLSLSLPKGLGGDDGPGTNPEQLFATGYAACFHSALKAVARRAKVDVSASAVTVRVEIGPDDDGFALAVAIEAEIEQVDRDVAATLVEQAHALCPYSRATRGNIVSTATLVDN
ncbi:MULTISPECIES: organic hydroperoxide resistance protein [Protofrankia]|uniref:Peroxiredoxin, Ohr subfamily n=2 Tax=Protofrankia TaxID=2994361 RepID=F8AWS6_9ACTN|nr:MULTISPECIES: organic hydroperoxide resistance protein [Protofrankia]AEH10301.1 peroxiredoxin, Ohr subfamily [Candidatus Protofrankia datiscae]KLL12341.1 osmotically inducible protein C [Protofrankia coriariae]ONH37356.1 osmotically inducible protein C [Protofrankia sp. BMG5.30]